MHNHVLNNYLYCTGGSTLVTARDFSHASLEPATAVVATSLQNAESHMQGGTGTACVGTWQAGITRPVSSELLTWRPGKGK
jgi:anaerobic ribonucleoside-triphosphate reductase